MIEIGKTISFADGRKLKLINETQAAVEFPSGLRVMFYRNSPDDYLEYGEEWTTKELDSWYSSLDEATQAYADEYSEATEKAAAGG